MPTRWRRSTRRTGTSSRRTSRSGPPYFFTAGGQRERLAQQLADGTHAFAIVEFAFGELDLHRVEAATLVDNVPSQRVLEKNVFERIGLAPRFLRIAGEWRDFFLFQHLAD